MLRARSLLGILPFLAFVGCGASPDVAPASDVTPAAPSPTTPPESLAPPAPAPELVEVAHARELRGAWVSFVWNGTWPSRQGLSEAASKAELLALLDGLATARANAVFLQVRVEGDALYRSTRAPWTRWLSGTMGQDPGWDPLAFAVTEAHARGLELHAWFNPYRALSSTSLTVPASHVTKRMPQATVPWGTQLYLDPAAPEVRAEMNAVLAEVMAGYDVDGLHFDDYFYPYPAATDPTRVFADEARYRAYVDGGGPLAKNAWRRQNVNALVRSVSELVLATRPDVRFGISPFGIYKPGVPEGITGLDAYEVLACDPVTWMNEGWVDYLVPQLYWQTTREKQAFGKLVTWWADLAKNGRSVFVGHDLTQVGKPEWPASEILLQLDLAAKERALGKGLRGSVFFTAKPLAENQLGLRASITERAWRQPASTPPLATALGAPKPAPPEVVLGEGTARVRGEGARVRSFAIYDLAASPPALVRLVPPAASGDTTVPLARGTWAISLVDRRGLESKGLRVFVP